MMEALTEEMCAGALEVISQYQVLLLCLVLLLILLQSDTATCTTASALVLRCHVCDSGCDVHAYTRYIYLKRRTCRCQSLYSTTYYI
jgi:hypothetical protein